MKLGKVKSVGVAAIAATVMFTGCGKLNADATLVTINTGDGTKDTITLGYGNFAAKYQQSMYDQFLLGYYGENMWSTDMSNSGSTLQDDTKEGVLTEMEEQYLAKLHASDYGVELSEDQKATIADTATQFIAANSKESLEVMGATEDYVKQYLEYRTYYSLVSKEAKEAADADIKEDDCWMRSFSYVAFETTGTPDEQGNVVELTEDEIAEKKSQAEELASAKDFDATVTELGVTSQTYSYLKGETEDDTMDMSIIKAAEALSEGDVSEVIEVEDAGYYVIRLDADHDEDASQTKRESLQSEAFDKLMETWKAAITWKVDEKAWAKVDFGNKLFKAPETEETSEEATTEAAPTEDTSAEETTTEEDTTAEEDTEETSEEETGEITEDTEAE